MHISDVYLYGVLFRWVLIKCFDMVLQDLTLNLQLAHLKTHSLGISGTLPLRLILKIKTTLHFLHNYIIISSMTNTKKNYFTLLGGMASFSIVQEFSYVIA